MHIKVHFLGSRPEFSRKQNWRRPWSGNAQQRVIQDRKRGGVLWNGRMRRNYTSGLSLSWRWLCEGPWRVTEPHGMALSSLCWNCVLWNAQSIRAEGGMGISLLTLHCHLSPAGQRWHCKELRSHAWSVLVGPLGNCSEDLGPSLKNGALDMSSEFLARAEDSGYRMAIGDGNLEVCTELVLAASRAQLLGRAWAQGSGGRYG